MIAPNGERVCCINGRGEELVGLLLGQSGLSLVICCHDMFTDKSDLKYVRLCQELASLGVPSLRFDFSGCGESSGRLFDLSYSRQMDDLGSVIDFAASMGACRIGLFGSSMGGAVALLGAARDERVVAVATLGAVGHPEDIAERCPRAVERWRATGWIDTQAGRIGSGFLQDARQHDVIGAVGVLLAPVLVIHGEEDEVVDPSDAHDIACAARRAILELVPGADHGFSRQEHLRPAIRRVAQFLAAHLRESA